MPDPSEGGYKLRALKLSAIAIALVVIVEVTIGLVAKSLAILSDGLHAMLDALTTVMLPAWLPAPVRTGVLPVSITLPF